MDECAAKKQLETISRRYQQYAEYVCFLAGKAKKHGLWEKYGAKLSALYLRLCQGPVRMAVVGESSTGKSTLINAFAGDFVAPENAGVCTAQPIFMLRHDEPGTFVRPYSITKEALPEVREVWGPARLLTRQYGAKAARGMDARVQPFVYVSGGMMPRGVTIVDTPGLNAADADNETTYGLFERALYSSGGERDVPEMILFVTRQQNLLQTEQDAIARFREMGVEKDSCFIVHNDFRQAYTVTPESYEEVNDGAVEGLRKSLSAMEGGDQAQEPADPWDFDSYLGDEDGDAGSEQVFSVNAMLARLQCVSTDDGVYNVLKYPPEGMTVEEFASWKALNAEDTTQNRLARVRDLFAAQGHEGYAPMQALSQAIERRALALIGRGALEDVPRAADAIAGEILQDCAAQMAASVPPVESGGALMLKNLICEAEKKIADFRAAGGAFDLAVKKAEEAPQAAVALHNSKIELIIKSFEGQKFTLVDLGMIVAGNFFAPVLLVPLARMLLSDDVPKRYNKILKKRGLGGRDLDALFDGDISVAGAGTMVQIILDLASSLTEKLEPDQGQLRTIAAEGLEACVDAAWQTNTALNEMEMQYLELIDDSENIEMNTDRDFEDAQKCTDVLTARLLNLYPGMKQPDPDELVDRVRGLMLMMKARGEVRAFTVKNRVYKEVVSVILMEIVQAMRIEQIQRDCGAAGLAAACVEQYERAWRDMLTGMKASFARMTQKLQTRVEEYRREIEAMRTALSEEFDGKRPA